MEIRSSKLFKQQVTDLVCYLKVTFGKRIAFRVKSEIEKKVFLLKLFPNMGTVEENYIFIHLLWDCRQDLGHLMELIKDVD